MVNEFAGNLSVLGIGTVLIAIALVMTFNKRISRKQSSGHIEIRFWFDYEHMPILGDQEILAIAEQAGFERKDDFLTLGSRTASKSEARQLIQVLSQQIPWLNRAIFKVFVVQVRSHADATYLLHQEAPDA